MNELATSFNELFVMSVDVNAKKTQKTSHFVEGTFL